MVACIYRWYEGRVGLRQSRHNRIAKVLAGKLPGLYSNATCSVEPRINQSSAKRGDTAITCGDRQRILDVMMTCLTTPCIMGSGFATEASNRPEQSGAPSIAQTLVETNKISEVRAHLRIARGWVLAWGCTL